MIRGLIGELGRMLGALRRTKKVGLMFYEVEDYTLGTIWDELMEELLRLPTRPMFWNRGEHQAPEGDWTLAWVVYQQATEAAYREAGIPKPTREQLPAIFMVNQVTGHMEAAYNVTAKLAAAFIRARIVNHS